MQFAFRGGSTQDSRRRISVEFRNCYPEVGQLSSHPPVSIINYSVQDDALIQADPNRSSAQFDVRRLLAN